MHMHIHRFTAIYHIPYIYMYMMNYDYVYTVCKKMSRIIHAINHQKNMPPISAPLSAWVPYMFASRMEDACVHKAFSTPSLLRNFTLNGGSCAAKNVWSGMVWGCLRYLLLSCMWAVNVLKAAELGTVSLRDLSKGSMYGSYLNKLENSTNKMRCSKKFGIEKTCKLLASINYLWFFLSAKITW